MRILGYDYKLIVDGDQHSIGSLGRFHAGAQEIQIAEGLGPDQRASTVIHEILEAVNYMLAIGLKHKQVTGLEVALYQVFTSNGVDLTPLLAELDGKKGDS